MNILMRIKNFDLPRPAVLLAVGTIIFFLASWTLPSIKAIAVITISLLVFYLGSLFGKDFRTKLKIPLGYCRGLGALVSIVALVALYFDFFSAGGVPLAKPAIRRFLSPVLTSIAFLLVPGICLVICSLEGKWSKFCAFVLMIFSASMMALLGYRTEVLAALIASFVTAYYCEIFGKKELLLIVLLVIGAFSGVTFMRGDVSGFSPRAASTVSALNFALAETPAGGLAHGYVEFADFAKIASEAPVYGGRNLVSDILGGRPGVSMTTMLYGPPYIDFGIFFFVIFLILGLIIGISHTLAKTLKGFYAAVYGILLAFLLIGIETGITDLIIWGYLIASGFFFLLGAYE